MTIRTECDVRAPRVLVIGSGIAGLTAALHASRSADVLIVTKAGLSEGATRHAQGGIAGAVGPGDSAAAHAEDTLDAGAGHGLLPSIEVLCEEGPAAIAELMDLGVAFDRVGGPGSQHALGLEGAHSRPRILHAGGDATGAAIQEALVAAVRHLGIPVLEHTALVDLLVEDGRVCGARLLRADEEGADPAALTIRAGAVLLATGGAGQLYSHTTNPAVATGDGVAAAARAGAALGDLELYQFHPTSLTGSSFLVSEAVRGEGARLLDAAGHRFMPDIDDRAELAPRDVVARGIVQAMADHEGRPVLLDATVIQPGLTPAHRSRNLATRFPTIDAAVRSAGIDWSRQPVPVTPAAHYWMGGIVTDLEGRTSLPGLLAAGECSRTGVHGANRLASNSLLEGAVFGARAGEAAAREAYDAPRASAGTVRGGVPAAVPAPPGTTPVDRAALQTCLWDHVGLLRTGEGLEAALETLSTWHAPEPTTIRGIEDRNLLDLARLVTTAALHRTASLGAHHRLDDTSAVPVPALEASAC